MRHVAITGMGIFSPIGNTLEEVHYSLVNGKSGISARKEWQNIPGLESRIGGVVNHLTPKEIPRKYRRTMGRVAILGAFAAKEAILHSALDEKKIQSERTGVIFGSTTGSVPILANFFHDFFEKGILEQEGTSFMKIMSHTVAANIAAFLGIKGRLISPCSACASSTQAIGMAYEMIGHGIQDIVICGGADDLHSTTAGVFNVLHAASTKYNDRPHLTPRPFDLERDGLVVSEGGGAIVLEDYDHALQRGAKIHGEVLGYATCCDGQHMTFPSKEGMIRSMTQALKSAKIVSKDLDYMNAHATGTKAGDTVEAEAIREVVGDQVPVSGTKGYTGHTLGACGAMEVIFSLLMMEHGFIAPTLNLGKIDPSCQGIFHVQKIMDKKPSLIMSNNFAFGGINASLIIKRK